MRNYNSVLPKSAHPCNPVQDSTKPLSINPCSWSWCSAVFWWPLVPSSTPVSASSGAAHHGLAGYPFLHFHLLHLCLLMDLVNGREDIGGCQLARNPCILWAHQEGTRNTYVRIRGLGFSMQGTMSSVCECKLCWVSPEFLHIQSICRHATTLSLVSGPPGPATKTWLGNQPSLPQ